MAMSFKRIAVLLAAPLLIAGCETVDPVSESHDPGFGEAVKFNAAVQTVNPEPVYAAGGELPGGSGQRGTDATKRYRSGQVKETQSEGTSGGRGAGGGGPG
jgi:hypothetical protein